MKTKGLITHLQVLFITWGIQSTRNTKEIHTRGGRPNLPDERRKKGEPCWFCTSIPLNLCTSLLFLLLLLFSFLAFFLFFLFIFSLFHVLLCVLLFLPCVFWTGFTHYKSVKIKEKKRKRKIKQLKEQVHPPFTLRVYLETISL